MATIIPGTIDQSGTFTPDDWINDFDLTVGARLIDLDGGYLIDINGTRLFLGGVPTPDTDDLDVTGTWVTDTI